jgi:streptomycin 6-kinase
MEGLAATAPRRVLLHGDFLTKNLLASGDGYRVVDPMPRLGDPDRGRGDVRARPTDRLDPGHTRPSWPVPCPSTSTAPSSWAVVWTVMVTVQAWRADQADLDALVVVADVPAVARRLVITAPHRDPRVVQ